jgi:flagellar motor protein MotB
MTFTRSFSLAALAALTLASAPLALAQQDLRAALFVEADKARAEAQAANAEQLAPATYQRAAEAYAAAENDLARNRQDRVRADAAAAAKAFRQAKDAAETASVTLASLIKTRADATNANASTFAAQQWTSATERFDSAVKRLEAGDIRGAHSRADEAQALYRDAELTSIKAQYLSQTRALLAEADQGRVSRYAPKTYERARSLLADAERALNENRYDTDLPRSLAQQANYEARHAIYLAKVISTMRDENRSIEDVILTYEDALVQIGAAADEVVQLDKGVEPVTTDLVAYIEQLRERAAQSQADATDARKRIGDLEEEVRSLDQQLGGVSQERSALVQRVEAEARLREQFTTIENIFQRDEARVQREGNRVIIRLVGLTFASGQATVLPAHLELLKKVAEAIGAYLTGTLGVTASRVSAVGYGETQPIASNDTQQGRARNRRIDVIIEPQLDQ